MEELLKARAIFNERNPDHRVSLNSLIVKMVSTVVKKHPVVNATWAEDKIIVYRQVDMGVAVSTDEGLVAPVIRACETKNVQAIHNELQDLITRARSKELKPEEFEQATFTVSNLGMYDIEQFSAIINPPGSAILALGKVMEKPVGMNGEIVLKPMMNVTLSCDHRVIDGAQGAVFMQDLKNTIEIPFIEYFT
jgi:pyruvate dehydrogenase E2 component (dihydrolipoamide acetyltransferase)